MYCTYNITDEEDDSWMMFLILLIKEYRMNFLRKYFILYLMKIVSEYDQEIPQSQTRVD